MYAQRQVHQNSSSGISSKPLRFVISLTLRSMMSMRSLNSMRNSITAYPAPFTQRWSTAGLASRAKIARLRLVSAPKLRKDGAVKHPSPSHLDITSSPELSFRIRLASTRDLPLTLAFLVVRTSESATHENPFRLRILIFVYRFLKLLDQKKILSICYI